MVWAHPVDAHFAAKSLVGWPKMWFQVWSMDAHGAKDLAGYGFAHVPTAAGEHEVEVATWCPEGTAAERLSAFFVGGRPRLKFEEVIHQPGDRSACRPKPLAWCGCVWASASRTSTSTTSATERESLGAGHVFH